MPSADPDERLRLTVFEEWDPIGVHSADSDSDDRSAYWDEYDDYLPEIARRLAAGDQSGLIAYLSFVRTTVMGMSPAPDLDAATAKNLMRRHDR